MYLQLFLPVVFVMTYFLPILLAARLRIDKDLLYKTIEHSHDLNKKCLNALIIMELILNSDLTTSLFRPAFG